MRAACIQAVQQAVGRSITAGEARGIEQRVRDGMLAVARQDPAAWQNLSAADRLRQGAAYAANELVAEARKKKQRIALTILAHDRVEAYLRDQVAAGHDPDAVRALERLIAASADGKSNAMSAESAAKGIMAQTMGRLAEAWETIKPGMLGFLANREAESQFMRALHGDTNGIRPEIAKAAKAWTDAAEGLRQRFNAAGGVVGKLDNWGMPHSWAQDIAAKAGKSKFVEDMLGWVDKRKYVHEDGTAFTDAELRDFLGEAWVTIVTNGANKPIRPVNGKPGGAIKANRGSQARQIHLRDGAAALEALRAYSGRNVFEAMVGHVNKLSRDIALIETFGPNADLTVQHFLDTIQQAAANADPVGATKLAQRADYAARLYDFVAGNREPPPNRRLAQAASMVRSWLTASKLGSAAITSISDEGTLHLTGRVNNLPPLQLFLNELRTLNPLDATEKRLAQRAGLLAHTMADEIDRFGTDTLGSHIPDKIANAVMRMSGLNKITEARRRAFAVTMMDAIGALTRNTATVSALDPADWRILRSKGITDTEWSTWRAATPDTWRGNDTVLTPDAIYRIPDAVLQRIDPNVPPRVLRERAASKLLAVVLEEQDIAVIEPGAHERTLVQGGTVSGTIKGELVRSFFQFKTFPISMIARHWQRGMGLYSTTAGKAGYIATLVAAQTVLGAVAMEINDIVSGRDPRSLNPGNEHGGRNWLAAVLKGGSLGLYGDFLFADTTQYGRSLLAALAGPAAGFAEDVDQLTRVNILQAMRGEETDAGAEAARFLKGYTPGSSLWYTKAALDRMVFQQMQEYFSPGYLARAKAKARQHYDTTYWWDPGKPPSDIEPVKVEKAWRK
jgi:hypothetical protein